ncbi:MAG: protein translocase subunit SecD [Planctomycetota bacterium]
MNSISNQVVPAMETADLFSGIVQTPITQIPMGLLPIAQSQAQTTANEFGWQQLGLVLAALAVLIIPFVVGNLLAKAIKLPAMGTRFGWILLAIAASAAMLSSRLPGLGVDLSGGTILIYEIDREKLTQLEAEGNQRITSDALVEPLTRRINPSGTQEIVIRPYGESQIEVIVPAVEQGEVDRIKNQFKNAGILRFAILANQSDHQATINMAVDRAQSEDRNEKLQMLFREEVTEGDVIGFWAEVDREVKNGKQGPFRVDVSNATLRNGETGDLITIPPSIYTAEDPADAMAAWVDSESIVSLEALMIVDPLLDVTGQDLAYAASTFDQTGNPSVAFTLNDGGARKFEALTANNEPVGSRFRQLGIVLDDHLLSAPTIQSRISKDGRITGRFTKEEVDDLVKILKAGQLPAALTPTPIAENQIDPTLGQDTIDKGVYAITASLILVLIFIMIYYRFSGVIACTALALNLAMILATMSFINQPLTLPGLAGLVLTVGMSVDANVLIFERIREELKKGAAARMAIRNGFAKATVTIIDANLTTLITAIVLYAIGTDQIRGFAVTLILGILFSMFTAIYVSRTFFDLAERKGFISLSMSDSINRFRETISGGGIIDFIGRGRAMLAVSTVLIIVGVVSLFARGQNIFDIDFVGGSSVQFRLAQSTPTDRVREIVEPKIVVDGEQLTSTVNGVSMDDVPENSVFKVDSPIEDVDVLKGIIEEAFREAEGIDIITYEVQIDPAGDPNDQSSLTRNNGVQLVAAQADEAPGDDTISAEPDTGETDEGATTEEEESTEDAVSPGIFPGSDTASTAVITLGVDGEGTGGALNAATLKEKLITSGEAVGVTLTERSIVLTPIGDGASDWSPKSSLTFAKWRVAMPLEAAQADKVFGSFENLVDTEPVWVSSSSVGSRVAGDMIGRAFGALFASLLCIIGYIWFRFQRVIYGLAAVVALLHDVLVTLGAIAVSFWLYEYLGFLLIDPFKISLTVVAALLTIIGYSLNDTIVVFDRIRETKGKAPRLTQDMVNTSINQTLSRTLLTSITTLIVVLLLYWFGGDGIHAFAFALVIGVLVGTYSSIFVASPVLLMLVQRGEKTTSA